MEDPKSSDDEAPEAVSFSASRAKSVEEVKKRAKARASALAQKKTTRRLREEILIKRKAERLQLGTGELLDPSILAAAAPEADRGLKSIDPSTVARARARGHRSDGSDSEDDSDDEEEESEKKQEEEEEDDDYYSGGDDDDDMSSSGESEEEANSGNIYFEDRKPKRFSMSKARSAQAAVSEPLNLQTAALAFRKQHLFGGRLRRSKDDLARARLARRPATVFVNKPSRR